MSADVIFAQTPLIFLIVVENSSQTDIVELRRGPMKITLEERPLTGDFAWEINFLEFGFFEIEIQPTPGGSKINEDPALLKDEKLSLAITLQMEDHRGQPIGGRMTAMPRELALSYCRRWNHREGRLVEGSWEVASWIGG